MWFERGVGNTEGRIGEEERESKKRVRKRMESGTGKEEERGGGECGREWGGRRGGGKWGEERGKGL